MVKDYNAFLGHELHRVLDDDGYTWRAGIVLVEETPVGDLLRTFYSPNGVKSLSGSPSSTRS